MTLPGTGFHQWDPTLRKDETTNLWRLVYNDVAAGNGPWSLISATSPNLTTWTQLNIVVAQCEGAKWLRFGGVWYVVGAQASIPNYLIFSENLTSLGSIVTPTDAARHGLGCHPNFIHVPVGDKSQLMLITFDNFRWNSRIFSWGNLDVYKVGAETNGWEWKLPAVLQ